jgi:LuxR family transcriptional regulator, regulator of acetate metabolism
MIVNDYVHSPVISRDYDRIITAEGLRAMVAAPVIVRETVRGVIYGASRDAVPSGIGSSSVSSTLPVTWSRFWRSKAK